MEERMVTVRVEVDPKTRWADPQTNEPAHLHKWTERCWRHLDTCQFMTVIEARVPSVRYANGKVEEVAVPWAERFQRVTKSMEQAVVVWLQACGNVSKVAEVMRLDWDAVNRIMKAAVGRGLKRREETPIAYAGVDEKCFRRGHVYASVLNDLGKGRVWDLVEGRKTENAVELFETLGEEQRGSVEAVAMDMWPAFEAAARKILPQADIVYDKFHISAHLNDAVDEVRKAEHRELTARGNESLKGTKYLWLRNFPDLRRAASFRDLYAASLKTSRAWRLKEAFAGLWDYTYQGAALKFFRDWQAKVKRSRLEPIKKVAAMIDNRLQGVLNYLKHRITNAMSEGLNSMVARVIANARGLRDFKALRIRVLFFLGKLDLSVPT
jgi:transposase